MTISALVLPNQSWPSESKATTAIRSLSASPLSKENETVPSSQETVNADVSFESQSNVSCSSPTDIEPDTRGTGASFGAVRVKESETETSTPGHVVRHDVTADMSTIGMRVHVCFTAAQQASVAPRSTTSDAALRGFTCLVVDIPIACNRTLSSRGFEPNSTLKIITQDRGPRPERVNDRLRASATTIRSYNYFAKQSSLPKSSLGSDGEA